MLSASAADGLDVRAISEKLARQEALVRDLEAKAALRHALPASGVTSMQRNASVTVGGYISTEYKYIRGTSSSRSLETPWEVSDDSRYADLGVGNADLKVSIQVSDHFDAFLKINLADRTYPDVYGLAEKYWVRWKNIANTGFGLKVGRDELVFGAKGYGYLRTWTQSVPQWAPYGGVEHNQWYVEGVNQVTPYWEGLDGRFKAELSFMVGTRGSYSANYDPNLLEDGVRLRGRDDGLRTVSLRINYEPVDGLRFTASAANFYRRLGDWRQNTPTLNAKSLVHSMYRDNNWALGLAASYRPAFLRRLNLWTQWVYGRNVLNMTGRNSSVMNAGLSWDFTDRLTLFAQGERLKVSRRYTEHPFSAGNDDYTYRGLAGYVGAIYHFGHGVSLEAGFRREHMAVHDNMWSHITRFKNEVDYLYAVLGFKF